MEHLTCKISILILLFTFVSAETPDICLLPEPEEDENSFCDLITRMYRYDEESEMCVDFIYGGCGGNDNKFESLKKCVEFCEAKNSLVPPSRCLLPLNRGGCKTPTEQFYFDKKAEECKNFTYNGCWGNSNRFEDIDECKELCEFS